MEPTEENRLNGTNEGPPLRGPTKVGPPLGGPTDMTGSPTPIPHSGHRPIQPPCPIQPRIITPRHGPRLDGTNEGPPLEGPTEFGPLLGGPTEENLRPLLSAVALSPTQSGTTGHGPWLNEGLMEVGLPLGGPTEKNRPLLGAAASSPTQLGTTGPSPMRLVTTRSCQHTGPRTRTMTTHYGSRHSGPTDDGPTDDGTQLRGPTDESPSPMGTTASSPTRSNTAESITSRRSHQRNSPRLDGPRHIDPAPRPISSRLGLSPPQMADVSTGPGPNDPAAICATALALLDRAESCTSSP